jgi:hypothetical protein
MRAGRAATALTPVAAVLSALTALACCLPWGIGAALGTLGLSVLFARFQTEFILLSVLLLGIGLFQIVRLRRICRRSSRSEMVIWGIGAAVVLAIVLFPEWVAGLLAHFH